MPKRNPRLRTYILVDGAGDTDTGSVIVRSTAPRTNGHWVDITDCAQQCCNGDSILSIGVSNTNGQTITAISIDGVAQTLAAPIALGQSVGYSLPIGSHTIAITINPNSGTAGALSGGITGGGTLTPACQATPTANVYTVVANMTSNDNAYLTLVTATVCS